LSGILGSTLYKDGKPLWAPTASTVFSAVVSLGRSLSQLRIQDDSPDSADLGDGVVARDLVPDIHLIPGYWKIDGYGSIRELVQSNFHLHAGKNYFEFPYDWRRDNRAAARGLQRLAEQSLSKWQKESGNSKSKVILFCHSMGGLIARYFLEVLGGWRITRALVTFGTPYRGSVKALDYLVHGYRQNAPITQVELTQVSELVRTLTSAYQLLPIYKCCTAGDGKQIHLTDLSVIPNLNMDRARAGLKFHEEIKEHAAQNNKDAQYIQYELLPIIGIQQPTAVAIQVASGRFETVVQDGTDGGDGTVPSRLRKKRFWPAFDGRNYALWCLLSSYEY